MKTGTVCTNCLPSRNGICSNSPRGNSDDTNSQMSQMSIPDYNSVDMDSSRKANLPPFVKAHDLRFTWSESMNGQSFSVKIRQAYETVVRWKRNIFLVPSGKAGEQFVREISRMFKAFGESTPLESIALTAAMTLPHLLLQKPHQKSKVKEHIKCLERRLPLWLNGDIEELLSEGRAIQQRLKKKFTTNGESKALARSFSKLMRKGQIKSAIRLLSKQQGSPLAVNTPVDMENFSDKTVLDVLREKHPSGKEANTDNLIERQEGNFHPIIFDCIDGETIRRAALNTEGAAGPSGVDAIGWRRLCTSFRGASDELCLSMASVARRISSEYVDPESLSSYIACRLIALDKKPGVRPIGVGEVSRRIISKAVLSVIHSDIKEAAGSVQLCVGQISGCEAGVHAMRYILQNDENDATLLVDANNAFNSLNRKAALSNIHSICPSLAVIATNMYRGNAELFIEDETILSKEGTTQGDPLAMSIYGIAILPLIKKIDNTCKQIWFADDASAGGKINQLKEWWSKLIRFGPAFGYYPNPSKTWLLVKEEYLEVAEEVFAEYGINIASTGRKHLGSAIGNNAFIDEFMKSKVSKWEDELKALCQIARTEPHAAYSALIHGLIGKWTYSMRTIPDISKFFTALEEILRNCFIPIITGRKAISNLERDLIALPCRLGGLGIPNPSVVSNHHYNASHEITAPLVRLIMEQKFEYNEDIEFQQKKVKQTIKKTRRELQMTDAKRLNLSESLERAVELAKEKGSSNWLTALPLDSHGFALHKGAFRDALCLRYGWMPDRLPTKCDCGEPFSIDHALNCPKGAFPTRRHNEIRDLTGQLLTEVCHDVCVEPMLQPLEENRLNLATSNKEDNARADIRARGFWGNNYQCAFLDVKVFNPNAHTNRKFSLEACYKHHEKIKKRTYEQRITEIEHGSFTPLVFSTSGGMGKLAQTFYKRLASLLAEKRQTTYQAMMGWLRCHLGFSLLRSAILCLRGARSNSKHYIRGFDSIDLAISEARCLY